MRELAPEIPGAADADVASARGRGGGDACSTRIRATLHALPRRLRRLVLGALAARRRAERRSSARSRCWPSSGHTYRSEGALWLRTTAFGDDKDRVLERSTGEHTYFAVDIAYHEDKRARGFDRLINVLGRRPPRLRRGGMKAAYRGARRRPRAPRARDHAVRPPRRGRRARVDVQARAASSSRSTTWSTEIGVDAARCFLLQRSHDTTIDLDLDLAREQSAENPVYYVQYAHARIASVLRKAGRERVAARPGRAGARRSSCTPPSARSSRSCSPSPTRWPRRPTRRAPHRIAAYALELAQDFTAFYRDCRVVGAEPEAVESFRLRPVRRRAADDRARARPARRGGTGRDVSAAPAAGRHRRRAARRGRGSRARGPRAASGPRCSAA